MAFARKGEHEAAVKAFERSVRLSPGDGLYWLNLGSSERKLGRRVQAIAHFRKALSSAPDNNLAATFLVETLREEGLHVEATEAMETLVPVDARSADWYLNHGRSLHSLGQEAKAMLSFIEAISRSKPKEWVWSEASIFLGHCLFSLQQFDEAATCYRMLADTEPRYLGAALYAAYSAAWTCDWTHREEDLQRLEHSIKVIHDETQSAKTLLSPFCLLSFADDPALSRWLAELAVPAPVAPPLRSGKVPKPGGKIRLSMLSADFHHHATTMLLAEVLEHIDRDIFELYMYSLAAPDESTLARRTRAAATVWREVKDWPSDRIAAQMAEDEIGIAFDLKGFTTGARLDVLARRPAPLQVAWLGYPGTSGASYIDYIIGDPVVTPIEHAEHFSEKIAQMPVCYQPNDSTRIQPAPLTRSECGLPEHAFVFASFNQTYKIIPEVFAAWCEILRSTDNSVLWLMVTQAETQRRLLAAAAAHGVTEDRLVFAPFLPTDRHRARLMQADLFLDSFPCNGHTTASDALWAGVPVLTLQGQSFAARVAASLLTALDLPELICTDIDRYVSEAVRLAQDPEGLRDIHRRLSDQRKHSALFDGTRFARDMGDLLLRMIERHDQGLPAHALPASIPLGPTTLHERTP